MEWMVEGHPSKDRRCRLNSRRWRPPDRHLLVQSTVPPALDSAVSAGQKTEGIRLRLEGGHECSDLLFGDRVRVDDLEVNTCGEQDTDDTRVGRPSLL
jgi:hypothetical protein